jgi:hypothetical protein
VTPLPREPCPSLDPGLERKPPSREGKGTVFLLSQSWVPSPEGAPMLETEEDPPLSPEGASVKVNRNHLSTEARTGETWLCFQGQGHRECFGQAGPGELMARRMEKRPHSGQGKVSSEELLEWVPLALGQN